MNYKKRIKSLETVVERLHLRHNTQVTNVCELGKRLTALENEKAVTSLLSTSDQEELEALREMERELQQYIASLIPYQATGKVKRDLNRILKQ